MPECDCSVIGWAIEINRRLFELVDRKTIAPSSRREIALALSHRIEKETESAWRLMTRRRDTVEPETGRAEIGECEKKSAQDSRQNV